MPTFTSSRLTQSSLPAFNTAFPDTAGAIQKGQAIKATERGFAKEDQREKWAMQLSGGGPAAMETLMQIRFKDPDYYKDIVSTQSALIDKEAAEMGLSKDKQNMFTEDVARSLTVISELGADNPAAARAAHADMLEKYPEMNLPKDISVYASEYAGLAMTQADAEKIRGENRSEAKTKAAEQRALGLFKEKETFKAGLKKPGGGVQVEFGEEGNLRRVSVGGQPGTPLSSAVKSKSQQKILDTIVLRDQMSEVKADIRPEHFQLGPRITNAWAAWREKGGKGSLRQTFFGEVTPEETASLQEFSRQKARIWRIFTEMMKQMSGAAINPEELERAREWLPDIGTTLFDGDSETQFRAKVDQFMRFSDNVVRRYKFHLFNGIRVENLSLPAAQKRARSIIASNTGPPAEAMPGLIRQRGMEIRARLEGSSLEPEQVNEIVDRELDEEFGA